MGSHYFSSSDFNRDPGRAKKAANEGAVFITSHDKPTHVLLAIEDYRRLSGQGKSIAAKLALHIGGEIEFEAPRAFIGLKPVDLS